MSLRDELLRTAALAALQEPVCSYLARPRQGGADAGLDRQVAAVLEMQRRMKLPPLESMEPAKARRFAESGLSPLEVERVPMARVIDTRLPVPARIFVPYDASGDWIVYFHGGGGVIGSARSSEPITRLIAAQTGCTVASIDYRLGPEHKHPAAIEDARAAWDAVCSRAPAGAKIAVAGDSFGGMLAACVDRYARPDASSARRRAPDAQVLIYPITDFTMTSPGFDTHGVGYLYTRAMAAYFKSHYLHDSDDRRAASPASWPEVDRAAPAIVVTAGFDPLCPEGDAHADRLRAAGGRVVHRRYPSLVHGFLSLAGGVAAARAAVDEVCADIVSILAS
ncbi:MAG: alpha/beta hydrolase [Kofleriaceae bacterium]